MAISWYHSAICAAETSIVTGDCHVRAPPFLAMTVVVGIRLHVSIQLSETIIYYEKSMGDCLQIIHKFSIFFFTTVL